MTVLQTTATKANCCRWNRRIDSGADSFENLWVKIRSLLKGSKRSDCSSNRKVFKLKGSDEDAAGRSSTVCFPTFSPHAEIMDRYLMKTPTPPKTIFLIRHGESMHNAHSLLSAGADLNDMGYIDAPLTSEGVEQAKALNSEIPSLRAELIVTSPMTRATQTCLHATNGLSPSVPIVVNHLCRERLAYSCDIGTSVTTLMTKFPALDYGNVPDIWWWTPPDGSAKTAMESLQILRARPPGAHKQEWFKGVEPTKVFQKRVDDFRVWLLERPERRIAVFAHGVFNVQLIGDGSRMGNCEVRKLVL